MTDRRHKTVHFFHVNDAQSKLNSICSVAQKHFDKRDSILIAVPSHEAAIYIDQLLWRQPIESFIPHLIVNVPSKELVVITTTDVNVNRAKVLINLRPDIHPKTDEYGIIYDLMDLTHPTKEQLSLQRLSAYKSLDYLVEGFSQQ